MPDVTIVYLDDADAYVEATTVQMTDAGEATIVETTDPSSEVTVLEVIDAGPPGPQGEPGDTGPPGTTLHAELTDTATSGHPASIISFTPADGSKWTDPDPTTVQSAIDRIAAVASEVGGAYVHLTGDTMTGALAINEGGDYESTFDDLEWRTQDSVAGSSVIISAAGVIRAITSGPTDFALRTFVNADVTHRFAVDASGKHEWGNGTDSPDTTLYRDPDSEGLRTNASLTVDDSIIVHNAGDMYVNIDQSSVTAQNIVTNTSVQISTTGLISSFAAATTDVAFRARVYGDSASRLQVTADGAISWGNGTALDTNLYRLSASVLATDSTFKVRDGSDTAVTLNPNGTITSSESLGPSSAQLRYDGLVFTSDTNLYRSAADTLKTDDSFIAPRVAVNASAWSTVEKLRVNTPTTADTTANAILSASATTAKPLVLQGIASQSANLFETQNSSGTALVKISSTDTLGRITLVNGNAFWNGESLSLVDGGSGTATVLSSNVNSNLELRSGYTTGYIDFTPGAATSKARIHHTGTFVIGDTTAVGSLGTVEKLRVKTPTTVSNIANVMIAASATTSNALVIQAQPSQTAYNFRVDDSAGSFMAGIGPSGQITSSAPGGGLSGFKYAGAGTYAMETGNSKTIASSSSGGSAITFDNTTFVIGGYNSMRFDSIAGGGNAKFTIPVNINGTAIAGTVQKFGVNSYTTVDNTANVILSASGSTAKPLVAQAAAASSAFIQEWQSSAGTAVASVYADGGTTVAYLVPGYIKFGASAGVGGVIRFNNTHTLNWRNAANSADLTLSANASDQLIFSGDVAMTDAKNLVLQTTTGTKIGTATTQKLAFWNATPIVQPTTAVTAATLVGGGGTTLTDTDTFDGYTVKQVVKALRTSGLLA